MHSPKLKQTHKANNYPQFIFDAIGTHWIIDIYLYLSETEKNSLYIKIQERIEIFDHTYSRFRNDSLVTQISQQAGEYTFPEDFSKMIRLYKKMYEITGGLVTPLIGNVLEDSGYDKEYSFEPKHLRSPEQWEAVLAIDNNKLIVKKAVTLDFGAIGKGYLIDIIGDLLKENGMNSFCIDAGGDILVCNQKVRIGLEHPLDPTKAVGVAEINNASICGSAGNRRRWGNFHHIINPYTLTPVTTVMAVWVSTKNAGEADALSTALFFVEPHKLDTYFKFDYLIIYSDFSFKNSQHFPSELYVV